MSIQYALLKGCPINRLLANVQSKHYQLLIAANGIPYRVAVNVQSFDDSEVEFFISSQFQHPLTDRLIPLQEGIYPVKSEPGGIALDYIRGNLTLSSDFLPLPLTASGPDNDLNEKLDSLIQHAIADEKAMLYAYGAPWGPERGKPDEYFGFRPGRGIHDVHMNQGNPPGKFYDDNGPWQDGGLLINFPEQNQWAALLLKFQTQSWSTEDRTGNHVPSAP